MQNIGADQRLPSSLFEVAASLCNPNNIVTLRDHYRSHVQIIGFSNEHFYQSLRMATRYDRLRIPYPDQPAIQWVNVQGTAQLAKDDEAVNEAEARAVVAEIEKLILSGYRGSIGVVSPFRAQINRIRQLVSQRVELAQGLGRAEFLCDTVHGFQGDERDVMFFSPAVSGTMPRGARWFVDASRHRENLFNVAITRARAALIVVGDRNAMLHCGSTYLREFVHYIEALEVTQAENNPAPDTEGHAYPAVSHPERVSEWERYFYPHLCRQLLPLGVRPIPQYVVEQYDLDFALFIGDRKLNIKIDGEFYHRNRDGELCRRDQIRNQRLIDLGWDVMRFWVYQVRDDLEICLSKVESWSSVPN
uniref:DNA2/NAM7 helicase-like C-terminal domain-containing protein n=1 Tax=mine drainage metagenome TaxID=410659 RepID=E6QI97_9ZZZZ